MNSSCGGIPLGVSSGLDAPTSVSTERSHWMTWSSSPADAKTVESRGCHSREVIGEVWCLKVAAGSPEEEEGEGGGGEGGR